METARLNGVEPFAWLQDVLIRMVEGHLDGQLDALLPWTGSARLRDAAPAPA